MEKPICGYCFEKIEEHVCPKKVEKLRDDLESVASMREDVAWDEHCKRHHKREKELNDERDKLLLQNGEYRKMLERLEGFGLNSGNWTGDEGGSAWNMTPLEDRTLDKLWDEVRALLSKTEKRKDEGCCHHPGPDPVYCWCPCHPAKGIQAPGLDKRCNHPPMELCKYCDLI
jgi:hypothetical protein